MNDRIKELADHCWKDAFHYSPNGPETYTEFDCDKFAELIISECLSLSDGLSKHYMNTHSARDQAMLLASIVDYKNEIKKHFGVKE